MADTFRALCAELVRAWDVTSDFDYNDFGNSVKSIVNRARAALAKANGPAVPESREPAAVTGQPSDEEWDALVERVWDKYQTVGYQGERFIYDGDFGSALDLVRKELSRWGNHVPAPPADGEVAELVAWLRSTGEGQPCLSDEGYARLTRAADLLQRLNPPQPVPVSERLPGPKDCDAIGCCWWYSASHGWELYHRENGLGTSTHWLPAHALPLPEVGA